MIQLFVVPVLCAAPMFLCCLCCGCHARNIMASVIKAGCMCCLCDIKNENIFNFVLGPLPMVKNVLVSVINKNILNFVLSPLSMVYMKNFMLTVIKLGCMRCLCWKLQVRIFLLSIKMNCLRCFFCAQSVSNFFSALRIMKLWLFWLCRINLLKVTQASCIQKNSNVL